ncbi:thioester-containing protein 1 allele R1-like isoform X4 [Scylla paramamosain]|uniref:thioester-containing protein 1 allele R1-like isoform X4 n=1 Tax=Scylla paramamosain TaxID=85552 RepID=UPI003082EF12
MKWAAVVVVVVAVGVMVGAAEAKGTYSVVAPRVLRPNQVFHVAVSSHGTEGEVQVSAEVGGKQDSGNIILLRQIADLQPDSTQVLKFEIGDIGPGQYNLSVSGFGALTFRNTTELDYVHKSYSVFIQTDKTIYKPGDLMRFRVVVVNPLLRPFVTGSVDIYVKDGAGNRVRQWKRVFTNRGVWSGELQLAEEPVLGDWNITVEVLGQKTSRAVQVAYYVLPKFEVIVTLPEYVTFDQGEMVATVEAKYTYGKAVKGEVTLQVTPTYKYGYLQAPYDDPIRVVKAIKGKTDVTIDLLSDARLKGDYARELEVTAYVKEELTERVQNATSHVTVYRYPYRLSLIRTSDSFKPGLTYTAFLKVSYQDDTPITSGEVTVRHSFTRDPSGFTEEVHAIEPSGIVTLEFTPPLDDSVVSLALEARYKDLTQWLGDIVRAQSPSNSFLQATLLTENPRVGGEVLIGLNATQPLVYFVYQVLGRGDVVFSNTLQAHKGTTHTFRFLATRDMAPRARLLMYYVREDGEVVADSLHFSVSGAIQNEVTVNLNPNVVDAAGEVDITITTKPNAFVGVLAVDQRALMLGTHNHFSQDEVIEELETYDPGRKTLEAPWHALSRKKRALFNWMGTTTTSDVFKNAGIVVLTNGYVHDFNPFLYYRTLMDDPRDLRAMESKLPEATVAAEPSAPAPRTYFPITWLFSHVDSGFNGVVRLREKAPDAITSYMISAFAIDDLYGLGVTERPTKLRVFRPFFVSMNLPAAGVVRGEAVAVEMVIFNYGDQQVTAQVTLENPNEDFLFADFANEIDQGSPAAMKSREVVVASGSGMSVSFMVVPQTIGNVPITVRATTTSAADVVTKQLLVKPEGTRQTVNRAMLIDLRSETSFSTSVNITTPPNIVNGSKAISVTLVGDVLGPAVSDLHSLVELPTGCGEQNMAKLVPNIVVMEYLKSKNQLDEALLGRAKRHLETGYQQQLNYCHPDGSFSAFGSRDKSGSTWLTAFVAKSLAEAGRHIEVEPEVVAEAVEWLRNQQAVDGSFPEVGTVNNKAMQGGAAFGAALTAYVTMALLTTQNPPKATIRNSINRGLDFLAERLDDIEDLYSLALTTYTLHLANHPHKDAAFFKLESKVKVQENEKWWESEPLNRTVETMVDTRSVDVEMTGYGLMTYVHRGLVQDALPIMRWLVQHRNSHGGFMSTQDTVVALAGLAKLAEQLVAADPRVNLRLIYGARGKNLQVTSGNTMLLQRVELPSDTEQVKLSASGSGVAVVQVTYHYNLKVTGPKPAFSLDPQLDFSMSDTNRLRLTSCIGYTSGNSSNMAVMDVSLPSGYIVDNDLIPGLYDYEGVKLVEKKPDSSGVLVYFDNLTPVEVCPTVAAYRVNKVAFQKPSAVKVYDYYDTSRQARQFYRPLPAKLCDICDLDECDPRQCEQQIIELNRQLQDPEDVERPASVTEIAGSAALVPTLTITCLALLAALLQH